MKIWQLFYTLCQGDKKTKGEKNFLFESVYKSRMLFFKNWVLVFSFMYLVSVDPMDRSIKTKTLKSARIIRTDNDLDDESHENTLWDFAKYLSKYHCRKINEYYIMITVVKCC